MNKHSYTILEFDKILEDISQEAITNKIQEKILKLEPLKDSSILAKEFEILRDFMDFIKYDGGFEPGGIVDISSYIRKIEIIGNYLEPQELWRLNFNLRIFRVFKNRLTELGKYKNLESKFIGVPILKSTEEIIEKIVDNEHRIKDDASIDLREIRVHKQVLTNTIKQKFEEIFTNPSYGNVIQEKLITIRDGRSVIPVKSDFKGVIKGIEHDRSSSGQTIFVEPLIIVSLNNKMKELEVREKDEIRKILLRIAGILRENRDEIAKVGEGVLELDFINAKSVYTIREGNNIPILNTREYLKLVEARHPLIPKDKVIPLELEIGGHYNTLLITGPNTGGKSVALKTAGLLTLMGLSGIPISASENSNIGVFSGVYADIGDEQSIEQSLSSFSAHLKNIQGILDNVTRNTLVLLDELGSGTDPVEGSAFAMAVIDYLKEKRCKTIVTTHYSEVKAHGYNDPLIETASMEFNVETLSPTYKLLIGVPGESNALTIAKRLGVSQEILERAKSYISDENKKVEKMILNIKEKSHELELMKSQVQEMKLKIEMDKQEYENKLITLQRERDEILKDAYEKSEKMVKEIQGKARGLIEKIHKEENKKEELKNVQKSLNQLRATLVQEKKENTQQVKKATIKIDFVEGDKVFVKTINQHATVIKINSSKESAIIQAGILKMELPLLDMKKVKDEKIKTYVPSGSHSVGKGVKYSIDLRGKMVEEGIRELELYLDKAVLSGYSEVSIIHGKGTGALREGILKYLKECIYVNDYRAGGHGEGGIGCTVVKLK